MTNHTPGPWTAYTHYAENAQGIEDAQGHILATIYCSDSGIEEGQHNVNLVVAAPDLLAACKETHGAIEFLQKRFGESDGLDAHALIKNLAEVIEKAEGELSR